MIDLVVFDMYSYQRDCLLHVTIVMVFCVVFIPGNNESYCYYRLNDNGIAVIGDYDQDDIWKNYGQTIKKRNHRHKFMFYLFFIYFLACTILTFGNF